jgi:hypothetical protein
LQSGASFYGKINSGVYHDRTAKQTQWHNLPIGFGD